MSDALAQRGHKGSGSLEKDFDTEISPIEIGDRAWLLALNNKAVPHVNQLSIDDLGWLLDHCAYARVLRHRGRPQGALIAFAPQAGYASPHYRWFDARYSSFLYIDRVIVDESTRGAGFGRLLYRDLLSFAAGSWQRVTCEVNLEPPNPVSLRFHEAAGFEPVGELADEASQKRVVLLEKSVTAPRS